MPVQLLASTIRVDQARFVSIAEASGFSRTSLSPRLGIAVPQTRSSARETAQYLTGWICATIAPSSTEHLSLVRPV